MIEAFGGRKFLAWIVQTTILLVVFVMLVLTGKLTDGMFIAWLSALATTLGIYVAGNAAVDRASIAAGPPPDKIQGVDKP
jgi:hypothetical protein